MNNVEVKSDEDDVKIAIKDITQGWSFNQQHQVIYM